MEMVALIIAIVALGVAVMALPFLNKPQWRVSYDSAKGYKLWCWIRNIPISNRILLWMGYERRTQSIKSMITVTDANGALISSLDYGITSSSDIRRGIVELKSREDAKVCLKDQNDKFGDVIQVGLYTLTLELWGDRRLLEEERLFRINSQYPFVEWVSKKGNHMSKPMNIPLTKSAFHALLRKAAQPIPKEVESPAQEVSETLEPHRPDDCTETRTNPSKSEGNED